MATAAYKGRGWAISARFSAADEELVGKLSRRPDMLAKYDGMEHLIFLCGRVTAATYKLQKQVLYDLDSRREFSHVVLVCEESVSKKDEALLRQMGVGVLLIRHDAVPVFLVHPLLRCFNFPAKDRIAKRFRAKVVNALNKIRQEDVCVGILDLSQVLEDQLTAAGCTVRTLGAKIKDAETQRIFSREAAKAARRVNDPRITRAHPGNHRKRRQVVQDAQSIVDDCLAALAALP